MSLLLFIILSVFIGVIVYIWFKILDKHGR